MSVAGTIRTRSVVRAPDRNVSKKTPAPFFNGVIQPKLTVGQVDDPYEREADAVADKVMRMTDKDVLQTMPAPVTIQKKCAACGEEEKLNRKEDDDDQHIQLKPIADIPIQRKCAACEEEDKEVHRKEANNKAMPEVQLKPAIPDVVVQKKCAHCEEEEKLNRKEENEEEEHIHRKPIADIPILRKCAACEGEEKEVHRKESGNNSVPVVSDSVYQTIQTTGKPLDHATRSFMESRFNYDFSKVQVHDDAVAHRSSKEIKARAYTHGQHIAFAPGQYQPNTSDGKQLLAHELTHVVQQNKSPKGIMPVQRDLDLGEGQSIDLGTGKINIDIRGKTTIRLSPLLNKYILILLSKGSDIPVTVKYGDMGGGTIYLRPRAIAFTEGCRERSIGFPLDLIVLKECGFFFDASLSFFDAEPQLIPIEIPELDTSTKIGTLALKVQIAANRIVSNELNAADTKRAIAWVPGTIASRLRPTDDLRYADFSQEAFLPFIYGKDYTGKNFKTAGFTNHMSGGNLIFNSGGTLELPNQQSMFGGIQLGDTPRNGWNTDLTTNIMGAEHSKVPIKRTRKGDLYGSDDALKLDGSWVGKGFKAKGNLRASFDNSNFFVMGTASYESKRAKGDLMFVVTDYTTAKSYATEFLPDEVANKSRTDPPPNPRDRLAFAGAGNISFTLFDGDKETRQKDAPPKDAIGGPVKSKEHHALLADASFVVEPEGYITIAGQVQTKEKEFKLCPESDLFKRRINLAKVTIARIPGPLTTSADFIFKLDLFYGAAIGPLTLSEIKASGVYSNRPDTASELELSALIKMAGKLSLGLDVCLSLEGEALYGLFSVELIKACLHFGVAAVGAIQARPTIQLFIPPKGADRNTPPEYYIRGSFNFDAAGQLIFEMGDSFAINLSKKEDDDKTKKDPKDKDVDKEWKYKRNRKRLENKFGSKDVEIPMDHTLGSEEIPSVSLKTFLADNVREKLKSVITDKREDKAKVDEYFEHGKDKAPDAGTTDDTKLKTGGYEEQGEQRGEIVDKTAPVTKTPEGQTDYTFDEKFNMNGTKHTLTLVVAEIARSGKIDIESVIMMASEAEEISEKIEEERQEIKDHADPDSEFKKKDVAGIDSQQKRLKDDAKKEGIRNELYDKPQHPGVKQLSSSIQNYGLRYKKNNLGTPDVKTKPKCDKKPEDAKPGLEIEFPDYKSGPNTGWIIEPTLIETPDKKSSEWRIKFRPFGRKTGNVLAPRAYHDDCSPAYYIIRPGNCEGFVELQNDFDVDPRIVNGTQIPKRTKAHWAKGFPLAWSTYQEPGEPVVGMDRIKEGKRWVRAHLINGKLCGKGVKWNLIPLPGYINNPYLVQQFEDELQDLVIKGSRIGKKYWFKAIVTYYDDTDNAVIGHYSDFVKQLEVFYGEAEKDAEENWVFETGKSVPLKFDKIPLRDDLIPNRVQG